YGDPITLDPSSSPDRLSFSFDLDPPNDTIGYNWIIVAQDGTKEILIDLKIEDGKPTMILKRLFAVKPDGAPEYDAATGKGKIKLQRAYAPAEIKVLKNVPGESDYGDPITLDPSSSPDRLSFSFDLDPPNDTIGYKWIISVNDKDEVDWLIDLKIEAGRPIMILEQVADPSQ
ncbi:MAG: hypothetical protein Q7S00_06950, partial [bacterium]|nr:hypothetical protein [bacterium]